MLKVGLQASSVPDKLQKQKKRLSFRDPEVEANHATKSRTFSRPAKPTIHSKKASASVEDLTLEDQALHIAHHVGSAFSDLSLSDNGLSGITPESGDEQRETDIIDSSPIEFAAYQRSCQLRSFKISAEDEEFLDSLVPPLQDTDMRGPPVEDRIRNCTPVSEESARSSSSIHPQVQLLRYHLDQQQQQTQTVLHEVQLLKDQLDAEKSARRKAQDQNHQLMQQNKDLLNHLEKLFQQIEDLEKQVQDLEQERRNKRVLAASHETKATPATRQPAYSPGRRSSTEQVVEKPTQQSRHLTATKRSPATTTSISKVSASPVSATLSVGRKMPTIPSRPSTLQTKTKDSGAKDDKETLRIGDTNSPILSGSTWKLKPQEGSAAQSMADKAGGAVRSRADSFSSYTKKAREIGASKSTLFGSSNSSASSVSIKVKKHSSSTSDLYNSPTAPQAKSSLVIDESPTAAKSAIGNFGLSSVSKLPRYQPYTGWQRRTSLTNEGEQVSGISKDSYKSSTPTSLFDR